MSWTAPSKSFKVILEKSCECLNHLNWNVYLIKFLRIFYPQIQKTADVKACVLQNCLVLLRLPINKR